MAKIDGIKKRVEFAMPNGIGYDTDLNITDATALNYDYYGYKNAAPGENCDNTIVALQFTHTGVKNPFWITLFVGAGARETDLRNACAFTQLPCLEIPIGKRCVEENNKKIALNSDEVEIIQEIVDRFNCYWFDGDGETDPLFPLVELSDLADELFEIDNISINMKISKEHPVLWKVKELEKAAEEAKEAYEKFISKERCKFVLNDQDAPKALVDFIKDRNIACIESEKIVFNEDYMPDSATVVKLTEEYEYEPYAEFIFDEVGEFELMYDSDYIEKSFLQDEFSVDKDGLKEIENYLDKVRKINEPIASGE